MKLSPYLSFDGNCETAMNYYKDILGGEITTQMRYSEAPEEMPVPDNMKDKIMHCTLTFNGQILMASDVMEEPPYKPGNNYHLSVSIPSDDKALAVYDKLLDGGVEIMPFKEVFWGGKFGMLVDKFGIQWMVSSEDMAA
jgi:PhnB protein